MLTLYSMPSSGNSYKARLMLAHLGLDYEHVGMEYETEALAKAHAEGRLPLGKLPVLVTERGEAIPESNAILCYLAQGTPWMPEDPVTRAHALGWMFWEQNQHEGVIAVRAAILSYDSRAHLRTPERLADLLERGQALLKRMDDHLASRDWLAGDAPSVADLSLYAYTHSAETAGGFDLSGMPALRGWLGRVAALPGHVALTDIS